MSAACTLETLKLAVATPLISPPLARLVASFRHWYVIGPGPTTATLKDTTEAAGTCWLAGCVTIAGANAAISSAFELTIDPLTLLTVTEYVLTSPTCTFASLKTGVPVPLMFPPSAIGTPALLQLKAKAAAPTALTLKAAGAPADTVRLCGWLVI